MAENRKDKFRQARWEEPLLIELAEPRRDLEPLPKGVIPDKLVRATPPTLPQLSEPEVVRHYTRLSQMNYGADLGFYPLGSCTMKYTPKLLEEIAGYEKFAKLHPYQSESSVQGVLRIMYELRELLCEISGMHAITLQPAAGAHGELTGLLLVRAFHEYNKEVRKEVIIPDTAHGTNPASARVAGFDVIELKSKAGMIDLEALEKAVSSRTACLMLTNPNTLGIFETKVVEIAELLHEKGALLYYDGANLNAILGKTKPSAMGCDLVHFNPHKTFGTPHGGGGPGAGPVGVKKELAKFLPVPTVEFDSHSKKYYLDYDKPYSIGKVKMFYGNFPVLLKMYLYIRLMGGEGLREVAEVAVLNANYILKKLKEYFELPFDDKIPRLHEFVLTDKKLKAKNASTLDAAKMLLDYGLHAPTIYFPKSVEGALMIEPTETEPLRELDKFIKAMIEIATQPIPKYSPKNTAIARVDEISAAKNLILTWKKLREQGARLYAVGHAE